MRTQASVFLFLFLVAVAGTLMPRIGEWIADADIGDPRQDETHVLSRDGVPAIARNLILGEPIQVCGVLKGLATQRHRRHQR